MPRPGEIVGLSSEIADANRGRSHQTDIVIDLVHGDVYLLTFPHFTQYGPQTGRLPVSFLKDGRGLPGRDRIAILVVRLLEGVQFVSDVKDLLEEVDMLPFNGKLHLRCHCPVTFLKVIVFRSAEGRYVRIGAMMVCYDQSVVGDEASGTVEPDRHHGVRNGRAGSFRVVDLLRRQLEAAGLHVLFQGGVYVLDKPHALIGTK